MSKRGRGGKRRSGCIGCLGCLGIMVVLVVALVGVAFLAPDLLRKVGILGPDPAELYSGAADPVGTEMVTRALETAGFEGVEVVVMPVKGREGQIAVITVDQNSMLGDPNSSASGEEQFLDLVQDFAQANQEGDLQIETVAFDLRGDDGESLVSLGVPQEAVEAYAAGDITRREFLRQVEVDFTNLISTSEVQSLMQEAGVGQ